MMPSQKGCPGGATQGPDGMVSGRVGSAGQPSSGLGKDESGSLQYLQCPAVVSDSGASRLNDLYWPSETGSEVAGAPVVAEEAFMQHVTRVHKVSKAVWDFYTRLAVKQQQAAAPAAPAGQAGHMTNAVADPTSFRYRTTWEDMPGGLHHLNSYQRPLTAVSSAFGPYHLAAASATGHDSSRSLPSICCPATMSKCISPPANAANIDPSMGGAVHEDIAVNCSELVNEAAGCEAVLHGADDIGPCSMDNNGAASRKDMLAADQLASHSITLPDQSKLPVTAARRQLRAASSHGVMHGLRQLAQPPGTSLKSSKAHFLIRLRPSIFLLPVLSPEHYAAWLWSIFMLVMDMTYIAFIMPLFVAFCPVVLGGLNWCNTIDLVAGLIYLLNLLVSLQIGFVLEHDYKKRLLMDGVHVARFYVIRGTFFIDVMAVIPVIYQILMVAFHIQNYWANRCFTFTMLLRLMRLVQLMRVLFVDSLVTSGGRGISRYVSVLGQYGLIAVYAVSVLLHNLACLAWLVALMEFPGPTWADTVQWATGGEGGLVTAPPAEQYLACLYWVITTATGTGYGDVTPIRPAEAILAMVYMLVGISMLALLIGSMAELLTNATSDARRARALREKMSEVGDWLVHRNIPQKLSRAVTSYYHQVWLHQQDHPTEAAIFSELPPYLRGRVATHIIAGLLDAVDALSGLDDSGREDLASRLKPVEVAPGHELCRAGDPADCIWLLQEGELLSIICAKSARQVELYSTPCLLGDSCLLADEVPELQHRPATLRALSTCRLWQLPLREMQILMLKHPDLQEDLMACARACYESYLSKGVISTLPKSTK